MDNVATEIGRDLENKIFVVIGDHPARCDFSVITAVLLEMSVTAALTLYGGNEDVVRQLLLEVLEGFGKYASAQRRRAKIEERVKSKLQKRTFDS